MSDPTQYRLVLTAPKLEAEAIFKTLETEFEEDGLAISTFEIDDQVELFEVALYVQGETGDRASVAKRAEEATGRAFSLEALPDVDWVTQSLEGLPPVRAGRFLVHGGHDRDAVRSNNIGIEIEAGRAFGTGHHGTTAGCLEMIETVARRHRPRNALDLGTGSAVLAIGLAKLARVPILATDIDPVAIEVAGRNVRLNGVQAFVQCATATGFGHRTFSQHGPFDLIVANILPAPLMKMAPDIAAHLAPHGDVVLSGILTTQRNRVLSAFRLQGLVHCATFVRGEWVTLHLRAGL